MDRRRNVSMEQIVCQTEPATRRAIKSGEELRRARGQQCAGAMWIDDRYIRQSSHGQAGYTDTTTPSGEGRGGVLNHGGVDRTCLARSR